MTSPVVEMATGQDRRNAAIAAGLVGAVVLVLGFGSGIGSVLSSRHHATASPASAPGVAGSSEVTDGAPAAGSPAPYGGAAPSSPAGARVSLASATRGGSSPATAMGGYHAASTGSPSSSPPPSGSTSGSPTAAPAPAMSGGSTCSGQMVAAAALDPFWVHFDHAHLEEGPAQQAGDLLNPNQYVKTHTVLVEAMLAPLIALQQNSLQGIDPFFVHLDHAHLEESPAQQAADLMNTNQYVKTHTVLVEQMTMPTQSSVEGTTGC